MNPSRAVELLKQCEAELRKLAADALVEGDDSNSERIADWARTLKAMAAGSNGTPVTGLPVLVPSGSNLRRRPRPSPDEYPKFFRRGDELVKVGWSRTERKEYYHRAPRAAIDALVAVVQQIGARGKIFTSDDFLPLKDSADGSDFPAYQPYVAMAWLKQLGLVHQHGRRGGYSLVRDRATESTVGDAWADLPEWRG